MSSGQLEGEANFLYHQKKILTTIWKEQEYLDYIRNADITRKSHTRRALLV
jgi:hypothetical protein